jgi:hypothetical protein
VLSSAERSPTLDDLVALTDQMERDEAQERGALRQRDREIGLALAGLRERPGEQVVGWLDRVASPAHVAHGSLSMGKEFLSFVLGVIAAVMGVSLAVGALRYDGTQPINIVLAWLVLVGMQVLFLLALGVGGVLGGRRSGRLTVLQGVLRTVVEGLLRLFSQATREGWGRILGQGAAVQQHYARLRNWLLMRWLQLFAVVFNVAVLVTLLAMLTFSDRAFAWSTTVGLTPQTMHRMTSVVSLPWAWVAPGAVPSAEMVEATRYFRMSEAAAGAERDPAVFGGWWSFLIASLITYGLLPRVLLLAWSHRRYRRALGEAIVQVPGVDLLLERLNRPLVQTGAAVADRQPSLPAGAVVPGGDEAEAIDASARWTGINWSEVPLSDAQLAELVREQLGITLARTLAAGGEQSLGADRATAAAAGEAGGGVVLVVKAWEPPRGEVQDFVQELRGALGRGRSILVLPIAMSDGAAAPARETDRGIWQRFVARLGDPWLRVSELKGQHV